MLFKKLILLILTALLSSLTACGDMYSAAYEDMRVSTRSFAYATVGNSIYSYSISSDGSLTQIGGPITESTALNRIGVHPSGDYIYVAQTWYVQCYKVRDDGSLVRIKSEDITSNGFDTYNISMSRTGRFLYAAGRGSGNMNYINILKILPDGTADEIGYKFLNTNCRNILVNPDETRLFVATHSNSNVNNITSYRISEDGTLSDSVDDTKLFSIGSDDPMGIAIDTSGNYLYYSHRGSDTITILEILPDGSLDDASVADFTSTGSFNELIMHPSGKYLLGITYWDWDNPNKSSSFGMFSDYTLYHISDNFSFPDSEQRYMALHPDLEYAYVTDNGTHKMLVCYNLEPGGQLTFNHIAAQYTDEPCDVKICRKTVFGGR